MAAGLSYEKSSRATNMTYTQMLFALAGDRIIFGHTPGIMSILGSSLILGGAVVVAIQSDPSRKQSKENTEGVQDDEARVGLMTDARNLESSEDHGRLRAA